MTFDEELINKILGGDKHCFRLLVQKYHVMVINTCYGLLHNKEDAEDVAQEVFIEVYQSLQKFRRESKLSTWIYRITINKSLNFLRKHKVRQYTKSLELTSQDDGKGTSISFSFPEMETPSEILKNKELQAIIHSAVDSLPDNQKVAFVMHKYEDLSYKEVAEVMELSLSAVESLIHRAKINLQKKLVNYYKEKL